jgi:hypothetical protein
MPSEGGLASSLPLPMAAEAVAPDASLMVRGGRGEEEKSGQAFGSAAEDSGVGFEI